MHAVLPEAEEINMANDLPAVVMMGGLLLLRPCVKAVSAFGTADAFLPTASVKPQQSFAMGAFEIFMDYRPNARARSFAKQKSGNVLFINDQYELACFFVSGSSPSASN